MYRKQAISGTFVRFSKSDPKISKMGVLGTIAET